jgi:hypothetical protein
VRSAEVEIKNANFRERLKEIGCWLDENRFDPSSFTYFFLVPGMRVRVAFDVANEAVAFAARFGGALVDAFDHGVDAA